MSVKGAGLRVTVNVRGLDALLANLRRLGDTVARDALQEDLLAAAPVIVEAAQRNAPRDPGGRPGFGADTIHAVPHETRSQGELARIAIGPSAKGWWLKFSELGTSKEPARPWLRPAFHSRLNDFMSIVGARVAARVKQAWNG